MAKKDLKSVLAALDKSDDSAVALRDTASAVLALNLQTREHINALLAIIEATGPEHAELQQAILAFEQHFVPKAHEVFGRLNAINQPPPPPAEDDTKPARKKGGRSRSRKGKKQNKQVKPIGMSPYAGKLLKAALSAETMPDSYESLLEAAYPGQKSVKVPNGKKVVVKKEVAMKNGYLRRVLANAVDSLYAMRDKSLVGPPNPHLTSMFNRINEGNRWDQLGERVKSWALLEANTEDNTDAPA